MNDKNLDSDKNEKNAILSEIDQLITYGSEVFTRYQGLIRDININPDVAQREMEHPDFPKFPMAETMAWKSDLDADVKRKIKEATKSVKRVSCSGKPNKGGGFSRKRGLI